MNPADLWLRLRAVLFRRRVERELQEELDFHIEMQARKNSSGDVSGGEAKRRALIKFGGVARVAEECRDARRVNLVQHLLQDICYAVRTMRRSPGFTAVAVISLALGIGANTAIFTLIDAVLLKPLPVNDPAGLVLLGNASSAGVFGGQVGSFSLYSLQLYNDLRQTNLFDGLCAFQSIESRISVRRAGPGAAQSMSAKLVSGNYFEVLGVNAAMGRAIVPSDDSSSAPPVAVVSFRYWKERLGGDLSVIGSAVILNGVSVVIVGVAPREFFGDTLQPDPPSSWLPISTDRQLDPERSVDRRTPDLHWLYLMGRLKPDLSPAQAQTRLTAALQEWLLAREGTTISAERRRDISNSSIELTPGGSGIVHWMQRSYLHTFRLLLGISLTVLYRSNFINTIEVRSTENPAAIAQRVRQALTEIDPELLVLRIEPLSDDIRRALIPEHVLTELAVFFGLLALALTCAGLYGLMSYLVQRRTGEIGVRIALGASRGAVVGMVIREVLVQGIVGILIGIPAAFAASQLIANQLYGVSATNPQNSAMAVFVLLLCIAIAGYVPARRASRVDPMVALKHE